MQPAADMHLHGTAQDDGAEQRAASPQPAVRSDLPATGDVVLGHEGAYGRAARRSVSAPARQRTAGRWWSWLLCGASSAEQPVTEDAHSALQPSWPAAAPAAPDGQQHCVDGQVTTREVDGHASIGMQANEGTLAGATCHINTASIRGTDQALQQLGAEPLHQSPVSGHAQSGAQSGTPPPKVPLDSGNGSLASSLTTASQSASPERQQQPLQQDRAAPEPCIPAAVMPAVGQGDRADAPTPPTAGSKHATKCSAMPSGKRLHTYSGGLAHTSGAVPTAQEAAGGAGVKGRLGREPAMGEGKGKTHAGVLQAQGAAVAGRHQGLSDLQQQQPQVASSPGAVQQHLGGAADCQVEPRSMDPQEAAEQAAAAAAPTHLPDGLHQLPILAMIEQLQHAMDASAMQGSVGDRAEEEQSESAAPPRRHGFTAEGVVHDGLEGAAEDLPSAVEAEGEAGPINRRHTWTPRPGLHALGRPSLPLQGSTWPEGSGEGELPAASRPASHLGQLLGSPSSHSLRSSGSREVRSSGASGTLSAALRGHFGSPGWPQEAAAHATKQHAAGRGGMVAGTRAAAEAHGLFSLEGRLPGLRMYEEADRARGQQGRRSASAGPCAGPRHSPQRLRGSVPASLPRYAGTSRVDTRRWRPCGNPSPAGAFPDRDMYATATSLSLRLALNATSPREEALRTVSAGRQMVTSWQNSRWRPGGSPSPRGHFPDKAVYASLSRSRALGSVGRAGGAGSAVVEPPSAPTALLGAPSAMAVSGAAVRCGQRQGPAAQQQQQRLSSPVKPCKPTPAAPTSPAHSQSKLGKQAASATSYAKKASARQSPGRLGAAASGSQQEGTPGNLASVVAAMLHRQQEGVGAPGHVTTSLTCVSIQDLLHRAEPPPAHHYAHQGHEALGAGCAPQSHFYAYPVPSAGLSGPDVHPAFGGSQLGLGDDPYTSGQGHHSTDLLSYDPLSSATSNALSFATTGAPPGSERTHSGHTLPSYAASGARAKVTVIPVSLRGGGGSSSSSPMGSVGVRASLCSPCSPGHHSSPRGPATNRGSASNLRCLGSYAANAAKKSGQLCQPQRPTAQGQGVVPSQPTSGNLAAAMYTAPPPAASGDRLRAESGAGCEQMVCAAISGLSDDAVGVQASAGGAQAGAGLPEVGLEAGAPSDGGGGRLLGLVKQTMGLQVTGELVVKI